jgi:LPXTG-motif cell wall-anchored protein
VQTAVPVSQTATQLPNTGLPAELLAFGGLALLAGGIALRRLART